MLKRMVAIQQAVPANGALTPRKFVLILAGLLSFGALLFAVTLYSEFLVGPPWLEPVLRAFYRVAFFLRLPLIVLTASIGAIESHYDIPSLSFYAVTSFGAPFFWVAACSIPYLLWKMCDRALSRRPSHAKARTITRRAFLTSSAGAIGTAGALAGYSILLEPQRVRVARYCMPIRDLPAALDGFRLIHVSDTHYGPFVALPYIRGVIDQANDLQGDVIVLTGDYVHMTPKAIGPGVDVLKHLRARLGVFGTLGNHDHWEGAADVRAAINEIGLPLLDNKRCFVTATGISQEPVADSICLGGLGDLWEGTTDFRRALANAPDSMPRIVLAHNPDTAERVRADTRVDLMCSGHTHGGQVWVPGYGTPVLPSRFGQKYVGGLCKGPRCPVIVSRGVGMAILPVRFRVRPEIGEITLVRA